MTRIDGRLLELDDWILTLEEPQLDADGMICYFNSSLAQICPFQVIIDRFNARRADQHSINQCGWCWSLDEQLHAMSTIVGDTTKDDLVFL